jgi:hypothetical protein
MLFITQPIIYKQDITLYQVSIFLKEIANENIPSIDKTNIEEIIITSQWKIINKDKN